MCSPLHTWHQWFPEVKLEGLGFLLPSISLSTFDQCPFRGFRFHRYWVSPVWPYIVGDRNMEWLEFLLDINWCWTAYDKQWFGRLRSMVFFVTRERVRHAIHDIDPIHTALRWRCELVRRHPYSVPGPNSLWHIGEFSIGIIRQDGYYYWCSLFPFLLHVTYIHTLLLP